MMASFIGFMLVVISASFTSCRFILRTIQDESNHFEAAANVQLPLITFAEEGSSEDESYGKDLMTDNSNDDGMSGDVSNLATLDVNEINEAEHAIENDVMNDGYDVSGGKFVLVHGDIMIRRTELNRTFSNSSNCQTSLANSNHSQKSFTNSRKWSVSIPYELDKSIDASKKGAILSGIDEIQYKTCLTFRAKERFEYDYIRFISDHSLCWSFIGRQTGGQEISIGDGCAFKSVIVHELLHALGFHHTHERVDRDNYIEIVKENIQKNKTGSFDYYIRDINSSIYNQPYDVHSVMHLKRGAFGKFDNRTNKNTSRLVTMKAIKLSLNATFGQPLDGGISKIDQRQINELYCQDSRPSVNKDELEQFILHRLQEYDELDNLRLFELMRQKLALIYKDYYFLISIWSTVSNARGGNYYSSGACANVWNQYQRNVVVCFTKKNSVTKTDYALRSMTWHDVFTKLQLLNSCDPFQLAKEGFQEAITHKTSVAAVIAVRTAHRLVSGTRGYAKEATFKCDTHREMKVIMLYGKHV